MGNQKKSYINIISVIVSVVIAFIVFTIFSTTIFTSIPAILFTLLGISSFFLIVLIISILTSKKEDKCVCNYGSLLLIGSVGTIVLSGIGAVITVAETILAVIFGIIAFFFALAVIEFVIFILCIINSKCKSRECCCN